MAIESNECGIYNVCTNFKTKVNNLFEYIRDLVGKDIRPVYVKEEKAT